VLAYAGLLHQRLDALDRRDVLAACGIIKRTAGEEVGRALTDGRLASMTPSGIAVSSQVASSQHHKIGSPVAVTFPTTGTKIFTVQVIHDVRQVAGDYILPLAAAEANFPLALDIDVFVKLVPGVSESAGRNAISGACRRWWLWRCSPRSRRPRSPSAPSAAKTPSDGSGRSALINGRQPGPA
jgi:hypothetical protein